MKNFLRGFSLSLVLLLGIIPSTAIGNVQAAKCGENYNGHFTFCSNGIRSEPRAPLDCNDYFGQGVCYQGDQSQVDCAFNADDNVVKLCVGGFNSEEELKRATYNLSTKVGANSVVDQPDSPVFTRGRIGQSGDKYWTCITPGEFAPTLLEEYKKTYIDTSNAACIGGWALGNTIAAGATGGMSLAVTLVGSTAAAGACSNLIVGHQNYGMDLGTQIKLDGNTVCEAHGNINIELINSTEDPDAPQVLNYSICEQIPEADTTARKSCKDCLDQSSPGIWTAVGCIKGDPQSLVQQIMTISLGIAGGVALLMILAASFLLTTAQNDPKKVSQAKELIGSAVIGLLFIIFSVTILQFVGVTIFHLPDFGV